jgi:hypothetical protein
MFLFVGAGKLSGVWIGKEQFIKWHCEQSNAGWGLFAFGLLGIAEILARTK